MSRTKQMNIRVSKEVMAVFEREAAKAHLTPAVWLMTAGLLLAGESGLADNYLRVPDARRVLKTKRPA